VAGKTNEGDAERNAAFLLRNDLYRSIPGVVAVLHPGRRGREAIDVIRRKLAQVLWEAAFLSPKHLDGLLKAGGGNDLGRRFRSLPHRTQVVDRGGDGVSTRGGISRWCCWLLLFASGQKQTGHQDQGQ
jgi:hypothetical protein